MSPDLTSPARSAPQGPTGQGLSRRWSLGGVLAAVAGVTVTTAGQTVPLLRDTDLLAPRTPGRGQGLAALPVNKNVASAGVAAAAADPRYRLRVTGAVPRPLVLDLDALLAMPSHKVELPLTCVEGWSVSARWSGLRLRDLLSMVGAREGSEVRIESLERGGLYSSSHLRAAHAWSGSTLLATAVDGERLDLDHGYPLRLIAPNRPGVMQTKWLSEVVVL